MYICINESKKTESSIGTNIEVTTDCQYSHDISTKWIDKTVYWYKL